MAKPNETVHLVRAWSFEDVLFEWHRYPPGPAGVLPAHVHDEYQLCLNLDFPGEYRYRRVRHGVPIGGLSLIHPGEMHAAGDPHDRTTTTTFRVAYLAPHRLQAAAAEVVGPAAPAPFFATPVVPDPTLAARFLGFHTAAETGAARLELDTRLQSLATGLVLRQIGAPAPLRIGTERRVVTTVREYLEEHYAEDVSLDRLARLAALSPYHLTRVFGREVGLPPHAYQVGIRVARAKALLISGVPVSRVAAETGFADQSHLTRHFKRLVGTPPGRYAR